MAPKVTFLTCAACVTASGCPCEKRPISQLVFSCLLQGQNGSKKGLFRTAFGCFSAALRPGTQLKSLWLRQKRPPSFEGVFLRYVCPEPV
jgi:hypothetical protein